EDLYAETTLERLPDRRRHAAADDHTHGIVGIVRPHRLTEDRRRHAAEHRERGRAVATANVPELGLREAAADDRAMPREQRRQKRGGLRIAVREREAGVGSFVGLVAEEPSHPTSIPHALHIADDALRVAG